MGLEYRPGIIGTNHLTYNTPATIRHIENLGRTIRRVMLECFDTADTGSDFEMEFEIDQQERLYIAGLRVNPNPFYRAMLAYFGQADNVDISFAYSKEENLYSSLLAQEPPPPRASEDGLADVMAKLKGQQQKFDTEINPVILQRVLERRPDTIIIGSAHGEYIHRVVTGSSYIFVDDEQAAQIYMSEMMNKMRHTLTDLTPHKKI